MAESEYRERKGIKLSPESERQAVLSGRTAESSVNNELRGATVRNAVSAFHEAGTQGAYYAGSTALTMSGIMNTVAVIKGEKSAGEAISDTVKSGGTGAVTGYAVSGGLSTLSRVLSGSSSQFLQTLSKSNIPGQVVTAVMTLGGAVKRYASGETNTQEFMLEAGGKGAGLAGAAYVFAAGQTLIPISVIGGAIGALAGSLMTGELYSSLIGKLQSGQLEREERARIIAECEEAVRQEKAFRAELEAYLREWFRDCRECFDGALSQMKFALLNNDADSVVAAANMITRKLGGQVKYETRQEFRRFLSDDSPDVF